MDEVFYRAKLVLEQVEPYQDANGYQRERAFEMALANVTGKSASDAVDQIRNHIGELQNWYATQPATGTKGQADG